MTDGEQFFESIKVFVDGGYDKEFGRPITVGMMMTECKDEREAILQNAISDGLKIDDYISLKNIWLK